MITPDNLEPNPKNPIIAAFFRNIGYADQLGSGVRNLFKYCKFYSGQEPKFAEGDVFRICVPLNDEYSYDQNTTQNTTQSTTQNTTQSTTQSLVERIVDLLKENPNLSQSQVAQILNINHNTVKYHFRKLQENGNIIREGTSRKGHWVIK